MPNPYFQFKQFTVRHDKCAMKVGTDGVLLGAWAPVQDVKRILDVGAGSGLISLQLAQRNPEAVITSVEIDPAAAAQAQENIQSSPWSNRMEVVCCDFRKYHPEDKFDLIVSNPPYFVDSLQSPDPGRNAGRHTVSLSYGELIEGVLALLAERGLFAVILPVHEGAVFEQMALERGLHVVRKLQVQTKPDVPAKRVLMEFARCQAPLRFATLVMETGRPQEYSEAYRGLTRDFYLKF